MTLGLLHTVVTEEEPGQNFHSPEYPLLPVTIPPSHMAFQEPAAVTVRGVPGISGVGEKVHETLRPNPMGCELITLYRELVLRTPLRLVWGTLGGIRSGLIIVFLIGSLEKLIKPVPEPTTSNRI